MIVRGGAYPLVADERVFAGVAVEFAGRAGPRLRLHGPHTTSTSLSLIGLPAALRAHASGL